MVQRKQIWSTLALVVIKLVIFQDGIFLQASWFSQKDLNVLETFKSYINILELSTPSVLSKTL